MWRWQDKTPWDDRKRIWVVLVVYEVATHAKVWTGMGGSLCSRLTCWLAEWFVEKKIPNSGNRWLPKRVGWIINGWGESCSSWYSWPFSDTFWCKCPPWWEAWYWWCIKQLCFQQQLKNPLSSVFQWLYDAVSQDALHCTSVEGIEDCWTHPPENVEVLMDLFIKAGSALG